MMWNEIIGSIQREMPRWNDYLLRDFRKERIDAIPEMIGQRLEEMASRTSRPEFALDSPLDYLGYHTLTPIERIMLIRKEKTIKYKKQFDIRKTNSQVISYDFEFEGRDYHKIMEVPYMDNWATTMSGVDYYPILAIVERGGIYRGRNDRIIVQVFHTKPIIHREPLSTIHTLEGVDIVANNITAKLHAASRKKRKQSNPPIIIYSLIIEGWEATMQRYGVAGKLDIVTEVKEGALHVKLKDGAYLAIYDKKPDKNLMRVVTNLVAVYKQLKWVTFDEIKDSRYFLRVLTTWTYPSAKNKNIGFANTKAFIELAKHQMIDAKSIANHASCGIHYSNLPEMLKAFYDNIDRLVTGADNDLFEKSIASTEQMIHPLSVDLNQTLFDKVLNNSRPLDEKTIKSLMRKHGFKKWITGRTDMFRSCNDIVNDNFLLAIGGTRIWTTANPDTNMKGCDQIPESSFVAHPSFLLVTSIMTYSKSKPVVVGSINPFVQIDKKGNLIRPEWYEEIADVADK